MNSIIKSVDTIKLVNFPPTVDGILGLILGCFKNSVIWILLGICKELSFPPSFVLQSLDDSTGKGQWMQITELYVIVQMAQGILIFKNLFQSHVGDQFF